MVWISGFVLFILYRAFNAGMNAKTLFYRGPRYSFEDKGPHFDENKVFGYCMWTFAIGITWPVAVPLVGLFMLGKRYAKEA